MISFNLSRYLHYNVMIINYLRILWSCRVQFLTTVYTVKQPLQLISKQRVMVIHPLLHQDLADRCFNRTNYNTTPSQMKTVIGLVKIYLFLTLILILTKSIFQVLHLLFSQLIYLPITTTIGIALMNC